MSSHAPKSSNHTKSILIGSAALAVALIAGLLYLMSAPGNSQGGDFADGSAAAPHTGEAGVYDGRFENDGSENGFDGSVDKQQLIRDYKDWAKYPPNSRPLLPSHRDQIEYRRIPVAMQKMPVKIDGELKPSDYSCLLQPEKHTITEGEAMRVFLSCHKTGEQSKREIRVADYRIEARAGERKFAPVKPTVNDAGLNGDAVAGDRVQTFEFRPRSSDWADMHLTVNFEIEGDESGAKHSLRTHFFASPVAPARFTGNFREEFREGSLIVLAEVEVEKPGNYTIQANLMTTSDEPVAFARNDANLKSGRHFVELEYYGKILRDRDLAGPYRLVGLRGSLNTDVIQPEMLARPPAEVQKFLRNIRDDRPKRMVIPYYTKAYTTKEYDLALFTEAEYTSPAKERRLTELQALP
ncbi:MAG: hypothetical protein NXI24_22950 [bacterium]|nr:hypothetical protein [bacterium]